MQTTPPPVFFLIVWLLLTATCLADKHPSASIQFTPGPQSQRRHHRNGQYGAVEMVHGPLVPRMDGGNNHSELLRRAPASNTYGPLLKIPGCFYCVEDSIANKQGRDLLKSLSTEAMQRYMRLGSLAAAGLKDKCVFYTMSLTKPNPKYLSAKASSWACSKNKFSVWVGNSRKPGYSHPAIPFLFPPSQCSQLTRTPQNQHLWPNKDMATADPDQYRDFYGIEESGNWLHSIKDLPLVPADDDTPTMTQYFQNMSEAMAKLCSGEVVVMTQTPTVMSYYEKVKNIWSNKELPALRSLAAEGKISRVLVVDYDDNDKIWILDLATLDNKDPVEPSTLVSRAHDTEEARLLHRDACGSSGLAQMPAAGDPFADPYSLFA